MEYLKQGFFLTKDAALQNFQMMAELTLLVVLKADGKCKPWFLIGLKRNSYCNDNTDVVPWRLPAPIRINRNSSSCSATNNGVSLVNYIRRSSSLSSNDNQNLMTQRNNQTNGNSHVAHVVNPPHQHRGSRCHHACHHPSRPRPVISSRARSRERRTGMATMMPLSAWNLRRMQCPIPLEPPPPYRPWQLPPYLEDDPAPSYRSRPTTPANSVYAASD